MAGWTKISSAFMEKLFHLYLFRIRLTSLGTKVSYDAWPLLIENFLSLAFWEIVDQHSTASRSIKSQICHLSIQVKICSNAWPSDYIWMYWKWLMKYKGRSSSKLTEQPWIFFASICIVLPISLIQDRIQNIVLMSSHLCSPDYVTSFWQCTMIFLDFRQCDTEMWCNLGLLRTIIILTSVQSSQPLTCQLQIINLTYQFMKLGHRERASGLTLKRKWRQRWIQV